MCFGCLSVFSFRLSLALCCIVYLLKCFYVCWYRLPSHFLRGGTTLFSFFFLPFSFLLFSFLSCFLSFYVIGTRLAGQVCFTRTSSHIYFFNSPFYRSPVSLPPPSEHSSLCNILCHRGPLTHVPNFDGYKEIKGLLCT